uniref:Uncharacterized protein n=1 Tax=Arcella intermedia TaxID=1963864 RepID=A0A6B2LPT0_9EUKA
MEFDSESFSPNGIAIDGIGNIIVADYNNSQIVVFGSNGQFIHKFGSEGTEEGKLDQVISTAINAEGNILVVDFVHQIQIFG